MANVTDVLRRIRNERIGDEVMAETLSMSMGEEENDDRVRSYVNKGYGCIHYRTIEDIKFEGLCFCQEVRDYNAACSPSCPGYKTSRRL